VTRLLEDIDRMSALVSEQVGSGTLREAEPA
jgi:hypothetical protein